ncbi:MAG: peptidylprolyl isomerase [Solibacillus sp.]|uniref:peptidylprolyl isomerase n=1 Tax=Solibacillus sp. TaxID=1909654 RepID=UPI003315222F
MRRILFLGLLTLFLLTGCNSSTLSFSEIENVPKNVQSTINTDNTLQLIYKDEKSYYVVFHSSGIVTGNVVLTNRTLTIQFEVQDEDKHPLKQHVYILERDPVQEMIAVTVNGKSTHFDNFTTGL